MPEPINRAQWRRPDLVRDGRQTWGELVELSRDDGAWGNVYRNLVTCQECGQLYLSEHDYREDDRAYRRCITIENAERAHGLAGAGLRRAMRMACERKVPPPPTEFPFR